MRHASPENVMSQPIPIKRAAISMAIVKSWKIKANIFSPRRRGANGRVAGAARVRAPSVPRPCPASAVNIHTFVGARRHAAREYSHTVAADATWQACLFPNFNVVCNIPQSPGNGKDAGCAAGFTPARIHFPWLGNKK
jgi:hypothetical protein